MNLYEYLSLLGEQSEPWLLCRILEFFSKWLIWNHNWRVICTFGKVSNPTYINPSTTRHKPDLQPPSPYCCISKPCSCFLLLFLFISPHLFFHITFYCPHFHASKTERMVVKFCTWQSIQAQHIIPSFSEGAVRKTVFSCSFCSYFSKSHCEFTPMDSFTPFTFSCWRFIVQSQCSYELQVWENRDFINWTWSLNISLCPFPLFKSHHDQENRRNQSDMKM